MPGIDYYRLRQQITMREVSELIGFRATRRRGPQLRGPCPVPGCRGTSDRSFSVHLARHTYHCFACHSHGNTLDLWATVRGLSLHRAALELCQLLILPGSPLHTSRNQPANPAKFHSAPHRATAEPAPSHREIGPLSGRDQYFLTREMCRRRYYATIDWRSTT